MLGRCDCSEVPQGSSLLIEVIETEAVWPGRMTSDGETVDPLQPNRVSTEFYTVAATSERGTGLGHEQWRDVMI